MLFAELAEAELEPDMKPILDNLLQLKMNTPEMGEGKRTNELNAYIDDNLVSLKAAIDALPKEQKMGWHKLNELFLSALREF